MLADTVKYPFSDQRNRTLEAKFRNFANNDMRYLFKAIYQRATFQYKTNKIPDFWAIAQFPSFQVSKRSGVGSFTAELIHPIKFIECREK